MEPVGVVGGYAAWGTTLESQLGRIERVHLEPGEIRPGTDWRIGAEDHVTAHFQWEEAEAALSVSVVSKRDPHALQTLTCSIFIRYMFCFRHVSITFCILYFLNLRFYRKKLEL